MDKEDDGDGRNDPVKLRYELARLRVAYLVLYNQFLDVTESNHQPWDGQTNESGIKRGQAEY